MTLARKRERAWRVTRKLGSLVILAESERELPGESLESIGKELERKWAGRQGACIGPY